jgi:hypothetical protein
MSVLKTFLAAGLLALAFPSHAAVQSPRTGLVVDSGRAPQHRGVEILHPLRVERAVFRDSARTGGLWLPATAGTPMHARFDRVIAHRNGDWTWIGRVETELGEQPAIVTFGADAVFGLLPQRKGAPLRIDSRHGHTWLVENQPRYKRPPEGVSDGLPPRGNRPNLAVAASRPGNALPAVAAEIDVFVAYTPSMVTSYGSQAAVETRINQLATIANTAYVDSQAQMHINIVGMQLWNHTTANDNGAVLDLITNASTDPLKVQIEAWRNQFGADLVSVIRAFDNSTQTNCGLAWIGGYHGAPFGAQDGYSVSSDGENGGFFCFDLTFAHELGHNMGAHHDTTTSGGDFGAFTDSRGYRQTIAPGNGFATVMAYPVDAQELLGLFSNPSLSTCKGQPCGITDEANNVRTFGLSGPPISQYRATVSNPQPTLNIADVSVSEGDAGTKLATFTVSLSEASTGPVTYTIATANATATAGSDYVASTLVGETIAAGVTSKTFSVTINGDTTLESNETFTVAVSAVSGAVVGDGNAVGTITNDDGPALTIADVAIAEGNTGTKTATFTVKLSAAATGTVGFNLSTVNGTATAGGDFVALALAGQTMAAGVTSKTFNVTINGDTGIEANETFLVLVNAVTGPVRVTDDRATGTILNDDGAVVSIADLALAEGNAGTKSAVFTVALSQAATGPVTFNIGTVAASATAGSDFVARSVTGQTIATGQLAKTFAVTVNGDTAVEPNETFIAVLSAVTGPVTVLDDRAVATITNDDGPTLSVADVSMTEGAAGTKLANFVVKLPAAAGVPVSFNVATANGTATAGSDYVGKSVTGATIPAGQTDFAFAVTLNGDATIEPNETFTVNLSNAVNATIADAQALGTIINDEGPRLTIADLAMTEGNAGNKLMTFTLTLTEPAATPVTYGVQTVNGTALGGSDFVAVNVGGLSIPAGVTSKAFNMNVIGDTSVEANEVFYVLLKDVGGGASVFDDRAIGTITNDD